MSYHSELTGGGPLIDAEYYEDNSVPAEVKCTFPEKLVAIGYKAKKDIRAILDGAQDAEAKSQAVRRYLDRYNLRHIEPIQVSLLRGDQFLYHDWQERFHLGVPTPLRRFVTDHVGIFEEVRKKRKGICTWEDYASNTSRNNRIKRTNLGIFDVSGRTGIQIFIELHWGTFDRRLPDQLDAAGGLLRPARVEIVDTTDVLIEKLNIDPQVLFSIGPDRFEELVENRLRAMGFRTARTGNLYAKDGGVDVLFWPQSSQFPFLGAAQVKYHFSPEKKTVAADVRQFGSAIDLSEISTGVLVTNTSFTYDASWVASRIRSQVRLRDREDLKRWIAGNFVDDEEWREIPREIELAPGVRIKIPR